METLSIKKITYNTLSPKDFVSLQRLSIHLDNWTPSTNGIIFMEVVNSHFLIVYPSL